MSTGSASGSITVRLQEAVNEHNLEALAACFAAGFVNETPLHPARSFVGREQVRRNWAQIFAGVPDINAEVLRSATDGDMVWVEWEMAGTRLDGGRHLMRGVNVFRVEDGVIAAARFYLEPVQEGGPAIDAAVRETVG